MAEGGGTPAGRQPLVHFNVTDYVRGCVAVQTKATKDALQVTNMRHYFDCAFSRYVVFLKLMLIS